MNGKDDNSLVGIALQDTPTGLYPAYSGHIHIHQDDVRFQFLHHGDGILTTTGFTNNLDLLAILQQALDAGFPQARILALRPPFSQAFNRSLLEEYRADVLVTKASGVEGGVVEKVMAASELDLTTLMIRRPESRDHQTVSTVPAAVQACTAFFVSE